jgi:hypothetical protein
VPIYAGCLYIPAGQECRLSVFEHRVLKRIFGPKRDEVTVQWRKLNNEALNYLYCSPIIVLIIKSKEILWTRHVARMGNTGIWWGNLRERDHL